MTLNVFEKDAQGIFNKNPLRIQKSKGASTTVINAPFKKTKIIRATVEEKVHKEIGQKNKIAYISRSLDWQIPALHLPHFS